MPQVIELIVSWIVTNALTYLIIVFDERRMSEKRLESAWLPVSRDSAIIGFGPLALPVHFLKTRIHFRSWEGVVLGPLVGLLLSVVAIAIVMLGLTLMGYVLELLGLPVSD